ncbi:MAG: ankyrin repeat domain-containing protein, partial [Actinomycetia bacterium]|nr:ankyrin repeat domain-containing protein [Actinomycetes bacterium]
ASRGRKDMVELLVDRGADLEAKDEVSAAAVCD